MRTEKLRQDHLNRLKFSIQPMQADFADMLERETDFLAQANASGPCLAFLDEEIVLGCSGLVVFPGTGRSLVWCAYAGDIAKQFVWLFKHGVKLMLAEDWRRLEAYIDPTNPVAQRFAKLGGFKREGLMRSFWGDGTDRELWARVR